jgi:hypothetical protein
MLLEALQTGKLSHVCELQAMVGEEGIRDCCQLAKKH